MSGYSSIFSSGLLAPSHHVHVDYANDFTPSQPDSPTNVDSEMDTTPTKMNAVLIPSSEEAMKYFMPRSRASSNASATSSVLAAAPRLRRRRSSLSIANNGLSAVKSPQRNAGLALQRSTLVVGPSGRARSGSIEFGPAVIPLGNDGGYVPVPNRVGGGGGGSTGAIRPRRALRKPPPVPPPNVPLPALPISPPVIEVVHRRPLISRAQTAENFASFTSGLRTDTTSSVFHTPSPMDFTNNMKVMASLGTTPSTSSPLAELTTFWGSGAWTNEN